jgi:hypothetical protein
MYAGSEYIDMYSSSQMRCTPLSDFNELAYTSRDDRRQTKKKVDGFKHKLPSTQVCFDPS